MNRLDRIEKALEELVKSQKDTDRRMKETDKRMKETDKRMKETDKRMKETDKRMKETDRMIRELSRNVGGINRSLGKIPEAMSLPEIEKDFKKFGLEIQGVYPNIRRRYNGGAKEKELDIVLPAVYKHEDVVVVVETQLRYHNEREVDKFYNFICKDFKTIFREYKPYGVIGCICALEYGAGLETYSQKKGLFVMKPLKGIMGIINPKDFKFNIIR